MQVSIAHGSKTRKQSQYTWKVTSYLADVGCGLGKAFHMEYVQPIFRHFVHKCRLGEPELWQAGPFFPAPSASAVVKGGAQVQS